MSATSLPEAKKLLGGSVEESRAKRVEKQQSRYRDRGGIFVPAKTNPLLDVLLARGVNGESPVKRASSARPARAASRSPAKGRTKVKTVGKSRAKSQPPPTRPVAKPKRGKTANVVDDGSEQQSVPGPSRLPGTKRTSKRSTTNKSKLPPVETDEDEGRSVAHERNAKVANNDGTINTESQRRAPAETTRKRRKAPAGSGHDSKLALVAQAPVETKTAPKRDRGKKADNGETIRASTKLTMTTKSEKTKGKQKVVVEEEEEEELEIIDKPKRSLARGVRKQKVNGGVKNGRAKAKTQKSTPTGKEKEDARSITDADEKTARDQNRHVEDSSPQLAPPSRAGTSSSRTHAASTGGFQHGAADGQPQARETAKRRRPQLYVPSDSESEDDMPLRRPKSNLARSEGDTTAVADARPAKRAKHDKAKINAPVETQLEESGATRKDRQPRGATRKKHVVESEVEDDDKEGKRIFEKTARTKAAKGKERATAEDQDILETAVKMQRGKSETDAQVVTEGAGKKGVATNNRAEKVSRKRRKVELEDVRDAEEQGEGNQTSERGAKRRRKVAEDNAVDGAVAQVPYNDDRNKEAQQLPAEMAKHKGLRIPSRRLKENRDALVARKLTTVAKIRVRKPMPRLSLFPTPRMAEDSDDEIDFLR